MSELAKRDQGENWASESVTQPLHNYWNIPSVFISGLLWGDPHFTTLDNTTFTFNGLGEYTMVTIDDGAFELQARTVRTSGRGLGTVFSAAAAKERCTAVVEARVNKTGELEILSPS